MENAATERWGTDDAPTEVNIAGTSSSNLPNDCPGTTSDRVGAFVGVVINERYLVRGVLGHGATADVYLALDQQLEREVAIKILTPESARLPDAAARFHDEGLVTARLHHPNVAAVFDTGIHCGRPFIVMECLSGGTLAQRISCDAMAADEVRGLARQLLAALHAAHAAGIVHRDVKPSNILLSTDGVAKLADFGIAKDDARADRTAAGLVVGTPSYMAPERLRGAPATASNDLYALGIVLRHALHGNATAPPHDSNTADPWLAGVVAKATQADPEMRFSTAADMLAALDGPTPRSAASGPTRQPRGGTRVRRAVIAIVALLVIIGAAFAVAAASDDTPPAASGPTTTTDPLPSTLRTALDDLREAVGS